MMGTHFYMTVDSREITKATIKVIWAQTSQERRIKQCMRDHHRLIKRIEMEVDTNLVDLEHTGSQSQNL